MSGILLKVNGKIENVKEAVTRETKSGDSWKKQSFLLRTDDKFDNLYLFELLGNNNVDNFNTYNKIGDNVEVSFNVKTEEYNQKHYTTLSAWRVAKN
tara:strand:- start:150 stop:440 length:291 start_codon:yes stop_codon:yes gene_type:complete